MWHIKALCSWKDTCLLFISSIHGGEVLWRGGALFWRMWFCWFWDSTCDPTCSWRLWIHRNLIQKRQKYNDCSHMIPQSGSDQYSEQNRLWSNILVTSWSINQLTVVLLLVHELGEYFPFSQHFLVIDVWRSTALSWMLTCRWSGWHSADI